MFEKVLFPTDFSEFSYRMLDCITQLPGIREIVLLHIIDATHPSLHGWTREPERELARTVMEELRKTLVGRGVPAGTYVEVITEGDMHQKILAIAEREEPSLVVMGTHQKTPFDVLLHGSVSYDMLHSLDIHVLIMRQSDTEDADDQVPGDLCRMILSKVLVTTDLSENSVAMLSLVRGIPGIGEIHILHVVPEGACREETEEQTGRAREELGKIRQDLEQAGIRAGTHLRVADPAAGIREVAEGIDASLIIMGAHRKGWAGEYLIRSNIHEVVKKAKRPVLILRPGKESRKE